MSAAAHRRTAARQRRRATDGLTPARGVRSPPRMDELDAIAQTEIQPGWDVLDADDQRIGRVTEVHSASFSVETGTGGLRELAFTDVESADAGIVTISVSGDELTSDIGT